VHNATYHCVRFFYVFVQGFLFISTYKKLYLEYCENLLMRHNLDVMHIEKNICEALLVIILSITGKTKDTTKSRLDLRYLGMKHELQLREE
jgi:hypothetical protein